MIVDAFMFMNEFDLLMLRLHTLSPVVDHFVIVEAGETFSGKKKDFMLDSANKVLKPWEEKITRVKLSGFPIGMTDPWKREYYQRNAILRGMPRLIERDDIVLVSDADEIPKPEAIGRAKRILDHPELSNLVAFQMPLYAYTPHWRHVKPWYGTRGTTFGELMQRKPQGLRFTTGWYPGESVLMNSGWSFSYFGGVQMIQEKVGAYAHIEVDKPEFTSEAHILNAIENGRSLVPGDGNEYEYVEQPCLPEFMKQYPEVYGVSSV